MEIVISPSKNKKKKFDAIIDGKKTISFGDSAYQDYRKHKDKERKERYIARHKKNEDHGLSGVRTAGFWSANLLWNKKTLKESIDDINKKFKSLNVKMK
jgi:hypothetical protein